MWLGKWSSAKLDRPRSGEKSSRSACRIRSIGGIPKISSMQLYGQRRRSYTLGRAVLNRVLASMSM